MKAKITLGNPPAAPVRFSPDVEKPEPDEAQTFAELVATLRGITETTSKDYGHSVRAVHAKSTGLVKAELRVLDNLPPVLAQGLFAQPGTYPVVMRFSTSPGDLIADSISTPRGVAIKITGLNGSAVPDESAGTQDFIMIDGPAFLAPTPKKFLSSLKSLAGTTDKAEGAKKILSAALRGAESVLEAFGGESGTIRALGGHPITHPLGETYFTQTPFRYGDYIAKFALTPVSHELTELTDAHVDLNGDDDGLRAALVEFFATHLGEWDLAVQLCTDLEIMPVEDPSVPWPMDKSPYVPVGRIRSEPQQAWSAERAKEIDEGLAFSPWHCLPAHQPLGGINRARKPAYDFSSSFRGARSGCPFHDARAVSHLPE
jgi:hypothetical protein